MYDFRQPLFAIIVAILLTLFAFTTIEALYPTPEYPDCYGKPYYGEQDNRSRAEIDAENAQMQACQEAYDQETKAHNFVKFGISSVVALIAIIVALYLPISGAFSVALSNGLLLGGLIILFWGTIESWRSIATTLRPFIIFIELVIIIVVAWRKFGLSTGRKTTK